MINMEWITSRYFYDFEDRRIINMGYCFCWAWIAYLAYARSELIHVEIEQGCGLSHAMVKIRNLYFDSDHPRGIRNPLRSRWVSTNTTKNDCPRFFVISERDFRQQWNWRGQKFNCFYDQGLTPWLDELPFYGPRRSHGRRLRTEFQLDSRRSPRRFRLDEIARSG